MSLKTINVNGFYRMSSTELKTTVPAAMSRSEKIVLKIMENLRVHLRKFRTDRNLVQEEAGRRLGLSKVRYAEIERQNRVPLDYGCSLALLVKLSLELKISLPQLLAELQGSTSSAGPGVDFLLGEHLKTLSPEKTVELVKFLGDFEGSFEWLVNAGMDLRRLPLKKRLEIELDIHRAHLESSEATAEEKEMRRQTIYRLMEQLLDKNLKEGRV